jgi:hypothetical protein
VQANEEHLAVMEPLVTIGDAELYAGALVGYAPIEHEQEHVGGNDLGPVEVEHCLPSLLCRHRIIGLFVVFDAVALREEDTETQGLQPLRKIEVEASFRLGEQWSCDVDQHSRGSQLEPLRSSRAMRAMESRLEYLCRSQLPQAQVVTGRVEDRRQGREADEFGRLYRGTEFGGG